METKATNFGITKHVKMLGGVGEQGNKIAVEGAWQGVYKKGSCRIPEITTVRVREFDDTYTKMYRLKIPYKSGILEINVMNEYDHNEYLEYKREIMEMDEQSAAREAAMEDD